MNQEMKLKEKKELISHIILIFSRQKDADS